MRTTLERVAWQIPLPSRNFFFALALTVSLTLAGSGVVAAYVAMQNDATISDTRESGLDLASASAEFGKRLTAYDASSITMLLPGGLDSTTTRSGYDPGLLETGRDLAGYDPDLALAARSLVDAGVVATDDDHRDLQTLNDGLVRYTRLVETARTNAREGHPVDAAYLNQARTIAREDLLPVANGLRRTGEQRVAQAANDVGGPLSAAAVFLIALAMIVLLATTLVTAGRTRRLVHPALIAAALAAAAALAVVTNGVWSQSRELREAATTDIDAYVAANETAADLAGLRVTEITAVAAQGASEGVYDTFRTDAEGLTERIEDDNLRDALGTYIDEVQEVRELDEAGEREDAAESSLDGDSATQFGRTYATSADSVTRSAGDLEDRFDSVAGAGVEPLVPVGLGFLAAALAASGVLARGRQYR